MTGVIDLKNATIRDLNSRLQDAASAPEGSVWHVANVRGHHSVAVGIDRPLTIEVEGNTGYFTAGMNHGAEITVKGNAGQGVAETMSAGKVHVTGDASMAAGASGRGGLLVIDGNAAARCGISMKGIDIVVKGDVGHLSAFMAQTGRLVVLGDAGESLGDSIYEARLYVRGAVTSLGADCIEKPLRDEHRAELAGLLAAAGVTNVPVDAFRRYGSARDLYHFKVDNAGAY